MINQGLFFLILWYKKLKNFSNILEKTSWLHNLTQEKKKLEITPYSFVKNKMKKIVKKIKHILF
jgi:hypothetical protein